MNDESHAQLEVKVNRLLDGELPRDERTELERQLLRNPDAQAMLRDYKAADERCRDAIDRALASRRGDPSDGRSLWWPAAAAAAAAAVLGVVLWSAFQSTPDGPARHVVKKQQDPVPRPPAAVELTTDQFDPTPAAAPATGVRRVDRFPVGLFDAKSGQFRIIQVDREQTQTQPVWLDL